jgi:hypothetical protein
MCLYLLLKPFITTSFLSKVALILKNFTVLIVYTVLIKANLFALVLIKVYKLILCLLCNIV